jgi:hypothetical protein
MRSACCWPHPGSDSARPSRSVSRAVRSWWR